MQEINISLDSDIGLIGSTIKNLSTLQPVFELVKGNRYLISMAADSQNLKIHEGRLPPKGNKHMLCMDQKVFGQKEDTGIFFGTFPIKIGDDTYDVVGMQGIGISDILDIRPGSKLIEMTFNLTFENAVEIQIVKDVLIVRILRMNNNAMLFIRLNEPAKP